ncbi:putative transcription factor B3-Domain family [Helianthus annuus]|nr:putative transcription factor B3-Domain family [Helianthus annuus]
MSPSCIAILEEPSSLKLVLPIHFVKNVYGEYWQRRKVMITHETRRSWPVSLRSVSGESIITDGWSNVIRDLDLTKRTILRLRIMEDKSMENSCFDENICGESFVTFNRYNILKIIVLPEAYVTKCYSYVPVNDCYNINAAGHSWKVETAKINDNYVFTKGCPKLFHDLGIEEDDLLLLTKTDNATFEIKIYRRGVELDVNIKEESDDESVLEIPKDTYYKNVDFPFCEDDDSVDLFMCEMNESGIKDEVSKNVGGEEVSNVETKSVMREEINQLPKEDVKKKGKHIEGYCKADEGKALICGTEVEMQTVSTVGKRTRSRLEKEIRKISGSKLKILDVAPKRVARKNSVDKDGNYEFTQKGGNRMVCFSTLIDKRLKNKVHVLKVRNMKGKTIDMNVRRQKNGDDVRYAIEGWPMFMKENGLRLGDKMHFKFISTGNLLILSDVDEVTAV